MTDNTFNGKLQTSIVLFLDILGFSKMIEDSSSENTEDHLLKRIWHALSSNISFLDWDNSKDKPYNIKIFSDNVLVQWPIKDDGEFELGTIIEDAAAFQFGLALEGFFTRGGLALGNCYVDDIIAFGMPLLEAYKLESSKDKAQYPRTILSNDLNDLALSHLRYYHPPEIAPHNKLLLRDSNGMYFINYLQGVIFDSSAHFLANNWLKLMMQHKQNTEKAIESHQDDLTIRRKYEWLATYHNFVMDDLWDWIIAILKAEMLQFSPLSAELHAEETISETEILGYFGLADKEFKVSDSLIQTKFPEMMRII